jgi:exosortase/archaeosortase
MTPPGVTLPIAVGTGTRVASAGVAIVVACTCAPAIGLFVTLLMTVPSIEPLASFCLETHLALYLQGFGA